MNLGLTNKTALVLGAGGGLGGAIALALALEGAKVAVADLSAEAVENTKSRIEAAGGRAKALVWNLADLDAIDPHIAAVERDLGPIDILVNNTGGPPASSASDQDAEKWSKYFGDMVLPVIKITDRVLPGMRERKFGRIITSTSSGVISPIPQLGLSNSLRMALVGWSKTLAREVGPFGITANIVLPGRIATDRITYLDEAKAKREGRSVGDVAKESAASIPVGRYGRPDEYGSVVAFLASNLASYITGSTIRVDGGLIASV